MTRSVARTGNRMPEVPNDGVDEKELPVLVPIMSPRIGRAVADDIKPPRNRKIAENAAVDARALFLGRTRSTDIRTGENAVPPVKPIVRPPLEPVDDVMPNLVVFEAIEHHLRRGIRYAAAVPFGDEQNIGRVGGPDAAKANFDSRKLRCLIPEDLPFIEITIVIGILKKSGFDPSGVCRSSPCSRRRCSTRPPTTARGCPKPWRSAAGRPARRR